MELQTNRIEAQAVNLICHKLFWPYRVNMSNRQLDLWLIPKFSGSPMDVPIVEWLENLELTCEVCEIDRIERVLTLHLKGPAQKTYWQLSKEQRGDFEELKCALIKAYSMDSFVAFDHFARRQLCLGETVDKFLMELQRLALLIGEMPLECWIRSTFLNGLLHHVKGLLKSSTRMEVLSLQELLEKRKAILINEKASAIWGGPPCDNCPTTTSTCFRCGSLNHLVRNCLTRNSGWNKNHEVCPAMLCYQCGKVGHLQRNCPENRVADEELVPASSPNKA